MNRLHFTLALHLYWFIVVRGREGWCGHHLSYMCICTVPAGDVGRVEGGGRGRGDERDGGRAGDAGDGGRAGDVGDGGRAGHIGGGVGATHRVG